MTAIMLDTQECSSNLLESKVCLTTVTPVLLNYLFLIYIYSAIHFDLYLPFGLCQYFCIFLGLKGGPHPEATNIRQS